MKFFKNLFCKKNKNNFTQTKQIGFYSLNIIGYGFVGSSLGHLFEQNNLHFNVFDPIDKIGDFIYCGNIHSLVLFSESENDINYYFVAVPTPSASDGSCDTSIVENVLEELSETITKKSIVLIKSTVVPGTISKLQDKFNSELITVLFQPEFLRENTAKEDMYNADFTLISNSTVENNLLLQDLFINHIYKHKDNTVIFRNITELELFKYTLNNYLAVKIWYFNQIYEVCEKINVDYQSLKTLFPLDKRIGEYGTHVPGPDGKFGYGKKCLKKESKSMVKFLEELELDNSVMTNIVNENIRMRYKK